MPIHTRAYVGTLTGYVYSIGQFLLAGVAYAVPHWRYLQLLVSVPFFVFFIYSWCVVPMAGWQGRANVPGGLQRTGLLPTLLTQTFHLTKPEKVNPSLPPHWHTWGN